MIIAPHQLQMSTGHFVLLQAHSLMGPDHLRALTEHASQLPDTDPNKIPLERLAARIGQLPLCPTALVSVASGLPNASPTLIKTPMHMVVMPATFGASTPERADEPIMVSGSTDLWRPTADPAQWAHVPEIAQNIHLLEAIPAFKDQLPPGRLRAIHACATFAAEHAQGLWRAVVPDVQRDMIDTRAYVSYDTQEGGYVMAQHLGTHTFDLACARTSQSPHGARVCTEGLHRHSDARGRFALLPVRLQVHAPPTDHPWPQDNPVLQHLDRLRAQTPVHPTPAFTPDIDRLARGQSYVVYDTTTQSYLIDRRSPGGLLAQATLHDSHRSALDSALSWSLEQKTPRDKHLVLRVQVDLLPLPTSAIHLDENMKAVQAQQCARTLNEHVAPAAPPRTPTRM